VICLISGGGSSLLEALPDGITLADLRKTVDILLAGGAPIETLNVVRKQLSLVKGGRLARRIAPARCISLVLSDVIGDPPDAIASGPTAPDQSSFADALRALDTYGKGKRVPKAVRDYLRKGSEGKVEGTVKPGDPAFERQSYHIIGNNRLALAAAAQTARTLGFYPLLLSSRIQGEAREAAALICAIARDVIERNTPVLGPVCLLFGGETTVTLRGKGKGGRNQEFALASLLAMAAVPGDYLLAAVGTDGTDGPTDAAGALAAPEIWRRAKVLRLDPHEYLQRNDAYRFFDACDGLIRTGPTGTNVMDIGCVLLP
jgi:hydroxypyruvate reductase